MSLAIAHPELKHALALHRQGLIVKVDALRMVELEDEFRRSGDHFQAGAAKELYERYLKRALALAEPEDT